MRAFARRLGESTERTVSDWCGPMRTAAQGHARTATTARQPAPWLLQAHRLAVGPGVANAYVLNQWEALARYTTDGDLHIDNNISERTLKLIGMGRIQLAVFGSDQGGQTAAVLFSFPFAYLRDVFDRLATHPAERLDELVPRRDGGALDQVAFVVVAVAVGGVGHHAVARREEKGTRLVLMTQLFVRT